MSQNDNGDILESLTEISYKQRSERKKEIDSLVKMSWSKDDDESHSAKSLQSCPTLWDPIDSSPPGSPSLGFSRQEHWSRLPFPSPMHESENLGSSILCVCACLKYIIQQAKTHQVLICTNQTKSMQKVFQQIKSKLDLVQIKMKLASFSRVAAKDF